MEVGNSAEAIAKFKAPVLYYGRGIWPLDMLKQIYPEYSHPAIDLIKLRCVGVRKCDAGGENGFLVAFSFAFLEHLARVTTDNAEVEEFLQEARNQPTLHQYPASLLSTLNSLEQCRQKQRTSVSWMEDNASNREFWDSFPHFLRQVVFDRLDRLEEPLEFLGGISKARVRAALANQEEDVIPDIQMKVMAKVFKLKILLFCPDYFPNIKSRYDPDEPGLLLSKLHLFQSHNVFHCLYPSAALHSEGYSLSLLRCTQAIDTETYIKQQLVSRTKDRETLPSMVKEDLGRLKGKVTALMGFAVSAQDIMREFFVANKRSQGKDFFVGDQIASHTMLALTEYDRGVRLFKRYKESGSTEFANTMADRVVVQATFDFVFSENDMTRLMKRCMHCQSQSDFILDCTHIFCRKCLLTALKDLISRNSLYLKPNGDTIESFVCSMSGCFVRINGHKLREILGEAYVSAYIHYVENLLERKICPHCGKIRQYDNFRILCECDAAICLYCFADLCRRNRKVCLCGRLVSERVVEYLKARVLRCSGCFNEKSLLTDYCNIECEDHLLCQDCLLWAEKKNYRRCTYCYRKFSREELGHILALEEKSCVFCNKDCRFASLCTSCGCIICLPCASSKAMAEQNCTHCYSCRKLLPEKGYMQLIFLIMKSPDYSVISHASPTCGLCSGTLQEPQNALLECQHAFHPSCLQEYLGHQSRSEVRTMGLHCPQRECTYVVLGAELFRLFGSEFASSAEGIREEESRRTVKCPQCGNEQISTEGENGASRTSVYCPKCHFLFCPICLESFQQNHDKSQCEFIALKALVKAAEKKAGPADLVSQCPMCKHPNIYPRNSVNVTCQKAGCNTRFCMHCSVPIHLYTMHGGRYHRSTCKFFDGSGKRERVTVCRYCQDKNRACSPPKELNPPCRFKAKDG